MPIVDDLKAGESAVKADASDALDRAETHIRAAIGEYDAKIEALRSHAMVALATAEKLTVAREALAAVRLHGAQAELPLEADGSVLPAAEAPPASAPVELAAVEASASDPFAPLHKG